MGLDGAPRVRHPSLTAWSRIRRDGVAPPSPSSRKYSIHTRTSQGEPERDPRSCARRKSRFLFPARFEAETRTILRAGRMADIFLLACSRQLVACSEAVVAMLVPGKAAMLLIGAHAAMFKYKEDSPHGSTPRATRVVQLAT